MTSLVVRLRSRLPFSREDRVRTAHIALDRSCCEACWSCIEVCPKAVLGKVEVMRHRHAVVTKADACDGCGRCVKACASGALVRRQAAAASSRT
jgi:Pyruvate/2-oxoacid:ferredoxin oxidoreductase delta subunit